MNGSIRSSAGLVWRHQRFVWWIWFVNLLLAWTASLPTRITLSGVLNNSMESARLASGFDITRFGLILMLPEVNRSALASAAGAAVFVFFVYLLFLDGGIFAVYLDDRKLRRGEFFENCGLYFWRMVRLAVYSIIPFAAVIAMNGGIAAWAGKLSTDAAPDRLGFYVSLGGKLLAGLLFLFVRLCFDLAQSRIVMENETRVLRTVWSSVKLGFRSGRLYAKYIGISLFAVMVFSLGSAIWFYLPHAATGASFIILELVTVVMISTRLWMKAASAHSIALVPLDALAQIPPQVQETMAQSVAGQTGIESEPPISEE